ncbi:MAG TPA: YeeE/YedE family protein [Croceibacterium sp.]|nr:YeeE/YedE family protein [Croceibacterium sp.]
MKLLTTFLLGLAFGTGLIISGMTSPDRVLGFLDVTGHWDPSLAFVMGGAVLSAAPIFWLAQRRDRPIAGEAFDNPGRTLIDQRLIGGAVLFGIGWGLVGICPGPALVDMGIAPGASFVFVVAMLCGLAAANTALSKQMHRLVRI